MPKRSSKREDVNELAFRIVGEATGTVQTSAPEPEEPDASGKNPAAVALGRLGGLRGGKARAQSLSARRRRAIAQKAQARVESGVASRGSGIGRIEKRKAVPGACHPKNGPVPAGRHD